MIGNWDRQSGIPLENLMSGTVLRLGEAEMGGIIL